MGAALALAETLTKMDKARPAAFFLVAVEGSGVPLCVNAKVHHIPK